jgi:TetR/AcrR family transcriptional regulator, fatty acid metabolism regulator protein
MSTPRPRRTVLAPDDRRRQLLEAATWVFARKGYRRAQISDVIARAGVARGTFYLYFKSKEQIFLAIVEDFHASIKAALSSAESESAAGGAPASPQALLEASARRWITFFASHRDQTIVILKEASSIDPRFEKGFADLRGSAVRFLAGRFKRLQDEGLANRTIEPEFFARLQLGMFDELLNAYVLTNTNADIEDLARQLAAFEWNGIRTDRKEPRT